MAAVAIACQGGGSHSAFTAGALHQVLSGSGHRVVALSGTSGGAICALLTWYGLLTGGPPEAGRLLERFWQDNTATGLSDRVTNRWLVGLARLEGRVTLPVVSPYAYPELARKALTELVTRHVDFDEVARLQESPPDDQPLLLVGAVDVATGDHRAFSSRRGEITVDAVLASAAVPPLFRAVHLEGSWYWDGLFSQNPPVRELPDAGPEEIWVIRVNPRARATEPTTIVDIADRRNELAGNLSLEQELYLLRKVNEWAPRLGGGYRHIEVREIALALDLDVASKLDRSPAMIRQLFHHGQQQARHFLATLPG
ncbi:MULTISPECIES: patatin-like phospholipase family protein [unclassified Geodermatophilus]|uniref:patatin-like phospholipase family protein n=1 Tax=unclassified Geodermatophilus TaxID=2637632 RepID=UPI003EE950AE